jgi:hypothetical protein
LCEFLPARIQEEQAQTETQKQELALTDVRHMSRRVEQRGPACYCTRGIAATEQVDGSQGKIIRPVREIAVQVCEVDVVVTALPRLARVQVVNTLVQRVGDEGAQPVARQVIFVLLQIYLPKRP